MTGHDGIPFGQPAEAGGQGKPRLVLMGEFSAGKSTLSNLLLGQPMLPTQVTATRLPPVHISQGTPGTWAVTAEDEWREIEAEELASLTPGSLRSIHVRMQADTLELCDLVDMPGISDPNMAADTWDEFLTPTDHVVWCTHSTQAWRQSEAALWERLRETTSGANLLLITQFDKLRNTRDQMRVLSRVKKEVEGLFSAVYPVSLTEAIEAGEDFDAWRACGAHDFMEHLIDILIHRGNPAERAVNAAMTREHSFGDATAPRAGSAAGTAPQDRVEAVGAEPGARIVPRRVRGKDGGSARPRPGSAEAEALGATLGSWALESRTQ